MPLFDSPVFDAPVFLGDSAGGGLGGVVVGADGSTTVTVGGCCNCGSGSGGSGSGPPDYGTPTLRNIQCQQCNPPAYDLDCDMPEVWRFSFVATDSGACSIRTGLDAQLQSFYLLLTNVSGGCPLWLACPVGLCPYCGSVSTVPGTPVSTPPVDTNSFNMYAICAGNTLDGPLCNGDIGSYTLTEDCMVIELRIEDAVESTWWICPLATFNCNGANTFDLVLQSRVFDCCTGATSNVSYPTSITIFPSATPSCVSAFLAP